MNPAIGELADMYGRKQQLDALRAKNPVKFQEMYNLEEQILLQIAELDAAGQVDEAVATYQELIMAIKSTYGVETLHV